MTHLAKSVAQYDIQPQGSLYCVMRLLAWRRHLAMDEVKHKVMYTIVVSEGGCLKMLGSRERNRVHLRVRKFLLELY